MMRRTVAILAALAALWAGAAWAVTDTQDGQSTRGVQQARLGGGLVRADSSMKAFTMSSTGGLSTYDEDRDRDYVTTWENIIVSTSIAAGAGDSTDAPINVGAYRYLKLLIKATPIGAAANTTVRLGLQFRECLNGVEDDTTSIFAEYLHGRSDQGVLAGTTGVDTTYSGHLVTGSATLPWSGEYVVTFNMNRSSPGDGVAATVWSYPNGVSIPLDNFFGRAARFKYLSIRVRNLNSSGPAVKLTMHMIGFAQ